MDAETKSRVRDRVGNRCEYCRIHQQHYIITFHIEHIVAQQQHGGNDESNRALACHSGIVTRGLISRVWIPQPAS